MIELKVNESKVAIEANGSKPQLMAELSLGVGIIVTKLFDDDEQEIFIRGLNYSINLQRGDENETQRP